MSVENKIREMMTQKLDEAFPGMGKNKETKAPSQGSSKSPEVEMMHKDAYNTEGPKATGSLAAGSGAKENAPMKQGSSQDATIDLETDQSNQGKAQSAKKAKAPYTTNKGPGAAPNFSTTADPRSVVNQPSSKGNVHREEVELDAENVTDEELEEYLKSLSEEELDEFLNTLDENEDEEEEEKDVDADEIVEKTLNKQQNEQLTKDVENLFASEVDLSEEFKTKATSLFEAVVTARVAHEMEKLQEMVSEQAAQMVVDIEEKLISNVDAYLSYVAEQWVQANEIAIESGLRAEITEDFISGLKTLFQEHYIEVPEEKYDVLGDMEQQIANLTSQVNESVEVAMQLKKQLTEANREIVFARTTNDLAQTEAEKLRGLIEEVEFENEALFEQKISVIKNNYFPKSTVISPITEETSDTQEISGTVARYAELLSRNTFGK